MKPNFALHTTQTDRSSALDMPEAERAAPEVHNFTAATANSPVQSELLPQKQQKDRAHDENDGPTTRDAFVDHPPHPLPPPEPPPGASVDHTSARLLSAASLTPRLSTPTLYAPVAAATAHAKPSQRGCAIDCPLWCLIQSLSPLVPFTAGNTTIPIVVTPARPSPDYSSQPWDALSLGVELGHLLGRHLTGRLLRPPISDAEALPPPPSTGVSAQLPPPAARHQSNPPPTPPPAGKISSRITDLRSSPPTQHLDFQSPLTSILPSPSQPPFPGLLPTSLVHIMTAEVHEAEGWVAPVAWRPARWRWRRLRWLRWHQQLRLKRARGLKRLAEDEAAAGKRQQWTDREAEARQVLCAALLSSQRHLRRQLVRPSPGLTLLHTKALRLRVSVDSRCNWLRLGSALSEAAAAVAMAWAAERAESTRRAAVRVEAAQAVAIAARARVDAARARVDALRPVAGSAQSKKASLLAQAEETETLGAAATYHTTSIASAIAAPSIAAPSITTAHATSAVSTIATPSTTATHTTSNASAIVPSSIASLATCSVTTSHTTSRTTSITSAIVTPSTTSAYATSREVSFVAKVIELDALLRARVGPAVAPSPIPPKRKGLLLFAQGLREALPAGALAHLTEAQVDNEILGQWRHQLSGAERREYCARAEEMASARRRGEVSQPRRRYRGARRGSTQGGATARPTSPMGEG